MQKYIIFIVGFLIAVLVINPSGISYRGAMTGRAEVTYQNCSNEDLSTQIAVHSRDIIWEIVKKRIIRQLANIAYHAEDYTAYGRCDQNEAACGAFYLSTDEVSFEELLRQYEYNFQRTAVYSITHHRKENNPTRVLINEMAKKVISFDAFPPFVEIPPSDGFFYVQFPDKAKIFHFPRDWKGSFLSREEAIQEGIAEMDFSTQFSLEYTTKQKVGDYYIRYTSYTLPTIGTLFNTTFEQTRGTIKEQIVPLTGCGEIPEQFLLDGLLK